MKKAYYKGWFKMQEVEIVAVDKCRNYTGSYKEVFYKYIIKLKNGKLKYVHENKIIFQEE